MTSYLLGGNVREKGKPDVTLSSIFEFNIDEGKWYNQSYHMSRPRYVHAVSVVDFKYYSKHCLGE